jgi:hypothetical protein
MASSSESRTCEKRLVVVVVVLVDEEDGDVLVVSVVKAIRC